MYSTKMQSIVKHTQEYIDRCMNGSNVSVAAMDSIKKYSDLIKQLDPSKIDFSKTSFFSKAVISRYWTRFEELFPDLQETFQELEKQEKIISNTLVTLEPVLKRIKEALSEFEQLEVEPEDIEYTEQLIVSRNMETVLKNLMFEYELTREQLRKIIRVSKPVFKMSIQTAKTNERFAEMYKASIMNIMSSVIQ